MMHTAPAAPAPTTHAVLVDMGPLGLVSIDVIAVDYSTAYRAAVEALLIDPDGVMLHALDMRLVETYGG